ncbi:ribonuclease Y [Chitinivibrio alkaliphilus]|uniref:Ribonuclease Y n=1 Tax=Chitinivibrio alkaliphilus ACht1 TaxID=1313304 RepID=U7DA88_9BACT|nr:ribonuclease Y [Chitinivibrio alkaliphilus]ERP38937.1 phosphodiesterase [Chitinivibrio alkaliphilus ACht1]
MEMNSIILVIFVALSFGFGFFWRILVDKKYLEKRRKEGEQEKNMLITKGRDAAELVKKEAYLAGRDEWYAEKEKHDKELEERKEAVRAEEVELRDEKNQLQLEQERLETQLEDLTARTKFIETREKSVSSKEKELSSLIKSQNDKLTRIAHMTQEEARKTLLDNLEHQIRTENAELIKERHDEAVEKAEEEAREIVLQAIQRSAADTTAESTVSVVTLPNDDMKGRIIGREGRNIRTFEELTGIDVIVDDTPEAVILSSFDPVRREVGRLALQELVQDGRIHPGRIEEMIKKSEQKLDKKMKKAVEDMMLELNVHRLKPKMIELMGKLKYRTSYGQNVLQHSYEVAIFAELIAAEMGFDPKPAVRAGFLHDIGKAIDREVDGTHSEIGAELARKYGENDIICNAIAAHHEDVTPISVYPVIVQAADSISSSRPGVRKETLEKYVNRLTKLEEISDSFTGVKKAYVIQAGREIRIIVEPEAISDAQAEELARNVAKKIEREMEYPGQIKVTIIREIRHSEFAK